MGSLAAKEARRIQLILAGEEELIRRKNLIYRFASFLNRRYGLLKTWGESQQEYYNEKYPLLNAN